MQAAIPNRCLIRLDGEEAAAWLQNLVTSDIDGQPAGTAGACALLSPQGKILFDFLVLKDAGGVLALDCDAATAEALAARLMLYRLRAKVMISAPEPCAAIINDGGLRDLRFADPLFRRHAASAEGGREAYDAMRIAAGVTEAGADYAAGDTFPHDANLDQFGAVGFRKGCYVGQEVVSRMQHRGTARRRVLLASAPSPLPAPFTPIIAQGREIGHLGTVNGTLGLAMLRLDRLADAVAAGAPVTAAGIAVAFRLPPGATFPLIPADGGRDG